MMRGWQVVQRHPPFAMAGALQLPPVSSQRAHGAMRAPTEAPDPALEPAHQATSGLTRPL